MSRSATCIFCDDVRHETGGKLSYVGVSTGELIVPSFPASIQKLFVVVRVRRAIDDKPIEKLEVRLRIPGGEEKIILSTDTVSDGDPIEPLSGARYFELSIVREIGPIDLTEAGRLQIFVIADDEELYAGGLRIISYDDLSGQAVDIGLVLAAIGYYGIARKRAGRQTANLAKTVLDFMVSRIPSEAIERFPGKESFVADIGHNTYRVFFPEPLKDTSRVTVSTDVEGTTPRISGLDRFGFNVTFEPIEIEVSEFEIHTGED